MSDEEFAQLKKDLEKPAEVKVSKGVLAFDMILTAVLVFSTSLVHFCITVGAVVAKKAKLLAAIGIYYLVNMGLSFVFQFLGLFVFGSMTQRFNLLLEGLPMGTQRFAVLLALLLVGTVAAAVASSAVTVP